MPAHVGHAPVCPLLHEQARGTHILAQVQRCGPIETALGVDIDRQCATTSASSAITTSAASTATATALEKYSHHTCMAGERHVTTTNQRVIISTHPFQSHTWCWAQG